MAKKVRKTQRAGTTAADKACRWTVRGVPAGLQKAAGDAARARGLTLGQWLTEVVGEAAARNAPLPAAAAAGWTEAIERRLERLEQAVLAGKPVSAEAGSAVVG